jgi:HD-like signal output (HDOD) protein
VLSIAMGAAVGEETRRPLKGYALAPDELWLRSVTATLAAECAAAVLRKDIPAEASAAALLCDVGKPALDHWLVGRVLEDARTEGLRAPDPMVGMKAERAVLGVDHAELGALIAARWGLPDAIVQAIRHHHAPSEYGKSAQATRRIQVICDVTHVADLVAAGLARRNETGEVELEVDAGARDRLRFTDERFARLCSVTATRLESALDRHDFLPLRDDEPAVAA